MAAHYAANDTANNLRNYTTPRDSYPLRTTPESSSHTLRCVHCVCDQVSGPGSPAGCNRTDKVSVDVQ